MTLRRRKPPGLSLVEVLIAVFVTSVGILGTASSLYYGIRSEKQSERRTLAVYQAREMLNLIRSRNIPFANPDNLRIGSPVNDGNFLDDSDDDGPRQPFEAPPFGNDFSNEKNFNFERRIEMMRLSDDPNDFRFNIAAIKVSVYWTEQSSEKEVVFWAYHRR